MTHRTLFFAALLLLPALGACALAHDEAPGIEPSDPARRPTTATERPACALDLEWSSELPNPVYGLHTIDVSPNEALAHRGELFGGQLFDARTGELIAWSDGAPSVDTDWRRTVEADDEGRVIVRDAATGEVLGESEAPAAPTAAEGWYVRTRAELARHASVAYALDCWAAPARDEARAVLRAIPLTVHAAPAAVDLGVGCDQAWRDRLSMLPSTDGSDVILAGLADATIARVDLHSHAVHRTALEIGEPLHVSRVSPSLVVNAARSQDDGLVAVSTMDGRLHLLDARTLEPAAEPRPAGVAVANLDTYMPSAESPVAFGPRSERLAFVSEEGAVAVLDLTTGEVEQTLERPFEEPEPDEGMPYRPHPNTAMALELGERSLLGSFEGGVARFSCEPARAPEVREDLSVEVVAPAHHTLGVPLLLDVRVAGTDQPVVRWVEGDGVAITRATLGPAVEAWLHEPGDHTLHILASDGNRTGAATVTVTVSE